MTALRRTTGSLCALLALSSPAFAQDLLPAPDLAPDIAALPRLAGDSDVTRAVNAKLDDLDARDLEAVNCYYGTRSDGPFREVEVLSDGPDFLSFFTVTGTYCDGAAHPWTMQKIINLDLTSGDQTDLRGLLPDRFQSADAQDELLTVLFLNYVESLPGDCARAYAYALRQGYLSFDLGLAEATGALMLWPDGLAYSDTPCLDAAYVPADQLREAGFGARLTNALTPAP